MIASPKLRASLLVLTLALSTPPASAEDATTGAASFAGRWFASDAPWNQPVPRNPELLPGSQGFIAAFLAGGYGVNVNTEVWTPAVLRAERDVRRCSLTESGWRLEGLPLHPDLETAAGYFASRADTDASLCIYSEATRSFYNLFGVRLEPAGSTGRRLRIGAFGVYPIDGSGWWDNSLGPWSGRASGASYCGGLVRLDELGVPDIWHALAMAWPARLVSANSIPRPFVTPARTTDGRGTDPKTAVPMGARLQVDPALSEERMAALGVTAAQLPIVRALQRFGAYVVDSSDDVMAIYVESSLGREPSPAADIGPLPRTLLKHARFVAPPAAPPLDSRVTVGQPTRDAGASPNTCLVPAR